MASTSVFRITVDQLITLDGGEEDKNRVMMMRKLKFPWQILRQKSKLVRCDLIKQNCSSTCYRIFANRFLK